jgi:hypothetical protein
MLHLKSIGLSVKCRGSSVIPVNWLVIAISVGNKLAGEAKKKKKCEISVGQSSSRTTEEQTLKDHGGPVLSQLIIIFFCN